MCPEVWSCLYRIADFEFSLHGTDRQLRELARQSQWKAAVPALMTESIVVLMAAGKIDKGEPLTPADDDRLMLAIERIQSVKAVFCGRY